MRRFFHRLQGFTFVELLIAISIITILATIGVIDFSHTRRTARDAVRKSDVNSLVEGIKLYGLSHTSYFIVQKGATCNVTSSDKNIPLTDPGCTGANGRSFGKVNYVGTLNGYTYGPKSIVEVLKGDGYMATNAKDPLYSSSPSQWDYTLMRCKGDWNQSFDKSDTYFAVWTTLETIQGSVDNDNTNRSCGGLLAAERAGIPSYDFAFAPEISPLASTRALGVAQTCYTATALQTVDSSGSTATVTGLQQTNCAPSPTPTCSPPPGGSPTATASATSTGSSPTATQASGIQAGDFNRQYFAFAPPAQNSPTASPTTSPTATPTPTPSTTPTPSPSNSLPACGSPTPTPSGTSPTSTITLPFGTTTPPSGSGTPTDTPSNGTPLPTPSPTFDGNGRPLYAAGNAKA